MQSSRSFRFLPTAVSQQLDKDAQPEDPAANQRA
jgi:hypothetical protein